MGRWPGGSDVELAARVLSRTERASLLRRTGSELPAVAATWTVAAALLAAAGLVAVTALGRPSPPVRRATGAVAAVLFARGFGGASGPGGPAAPAPRGVRRG